MAGFFFAYYLHIHSPGAWAFFGFQSRACIKLSSLIFLNFFPCFTESFYKKQRNVSRKSSSFFFPFSLFPVILPHILNHSPLSYIMSQVDRIATLLASGLPATSVATIVGLSPARISQIQKEEGFAEIFAGKQAEVAEKDAEELSISAKYLAAEHILIGQVMEMAPVSELRDVTAALRVVAERQERAKSRMNPIVQGQTTYNTIVQLTLPQHATPELTLSAQKEVIAIENRNLTPLSSAGVVNLFAGMGTKALTEDNPDSINSNLIGVCRNDTTGSSQEATRSPSEAIPFNLESIRTKTLADGARIFLDSLHPAPYSESF